LSLRSTPLQELIKQSEEGKEQLTEIKELNPLFGAEIGLASSLVLECLTMVKKER